MREHEVIIRYSDVDFREKINIFMMINLFQDSSTLQASLLGHGILDLHERNLVWVLSKWHVEVKRYPSFNEKVTVGTYPHNRKGFFSNRYYYMKDEKGEIIALADSLWILLNYKENTPARVTEDMINIYPTGEALPIEIPKTKILVPDILEKQYEVNVTKKYLDSNMHVNNAKYVEMALDAMKEDEYRVSRVEYRKQAHAGDVLSVYSGENAEGLVVDIRDSGNDTVAVMEFIND